MTVLEYMLYFLIHTVFVPYTISVIFFYCKYIDTLHTPPDYKQNPLNKKLNVMNYLFPFYVHKACPKFLSSFSSPRKLHRRILYAAYCW
jgi:hypothetical protein